MKPNKIPFHSILIALLTISAFSCSTAIQTRMLVPAKSHEVARLRTIAVLPFDGPRGSQVSSDIEALFAGIQVDSTPYFSVIERTAIRKIIREQSLQLSGLVNPETAERVGRLLGAEGIILGTVTQYATEDIPYKSTRRKCIEEEEDGKCKKWEDYKIACTERNAYVAITPKVINVSTGVIVASESLSGHALNKGCVDSEEPLPGRQEMLTDAKKQVLEKLRELVAPYYVDVKIKLLTKDDSKMPPNAKENMNRGIEWTKEGRYDRACEFWGIAYNQHPRGYALPYLMGVCDEISGNLEGALSYYEKADRNTGSPVKEISTAIGRISVSINKRQELDEQMSK